MTKREMKQKAQRIMKQEFGFAPAQKHIVLLEAMSDGSYIMWGVGNKEYQWREASVTRSGEYVKAYLEITDAYNEQW